MDCLLRSLEAFPYNWSAWQELGTTLEGGQAEVCMANLKLCMYLPRSTNARSIIAARNRTSPSRLFYDFLFLRNVWT